jgi:hypothetical protein
MYKMEGKQAMMGVAITLGVKILQEPKSEQTCKIFYISTPYFAVCIEHRLSRNVI